MYLYMCGVSVAAGAEQRPTQIPYALFGQQLN